jgi:acetyl esterase/lipase
MKLPLLSALVLTFAFSIASVFAADTPTTTPAKAPTPAKGLMIGDATIVPLWPAGAPGFEDKKDLPEKIVGSNVSGINYPTLTVYLPPKDQATGAAVIVAPGGGHVALAIQHEGYNVGQWLAAHGIAAFVLKYRLAKDNAVEAGKSPYTVDQHALADAQRALRLVRSRAVEWSVNPAAVGIIGFSAGGEVALLAAARPSAGAADAADPIDRLNARPDFFGLLYPGGLPRTDIEVTKGMPPAFLACGSEDRQNISEGLAEFYLKCKRAGVVAELHIYAGAGHGFGVRDTNKSPSGTWPARFRDWLADRKFLKAP